MSKRPVWNQTQQAGDAHLQTWYVCECWRGWHCGTDTLGQYIFCIETGDEVCLCFEKETTECYYEYIEALSKKLEQSYDEHLTDMPERNLLHFVLSGLM